MKLPSRTVRLFRNPVAYLVFSALAATCSAQTQTNLPTAPAPQPDVTLKSVPLNILKDQKAIWTSPAHIKIKDLDWLVPLAAGTGLAIATDRDAMLHVVTTDPQWNKRSLDTSNVLTGGLVATPVAMLGWGALKNNPHARETGLLGGQAILDGLIVEQVMKVVFLRERPAIDNANGKFFQTSVGIDGSFPSNHTVLAWSSAAVLADEYPSTLNRILIYTAATGVSMTRVMAREHFPSDVLVGSATGWLIGHYVFHRHHKELPEKY